MCRIKGGVDGRRLCGVSVDIMAVAPLTDADHVRQAGHGLRLERRGEIKGRGQGGVDAGVGDIYEGSVMYKT